MPEAVTIRAAMGLDVYPDHLRIPFDAANDAIGEGTRASGSQPDTYGANLWGALARHGAHIPALDQTIDRLPPDAFGRTLHGAHLTSLVKLWATYQAPNLHAAYLVFKKTMLDVGWKPSQVNSHLVVSLRMEEMMYGEPMMASKPADFSQLDMTGLNARERAVVERIRGTLAFG
jgi:hypothetical protein